jgi:hypothetical protein
MYLAQSLALHHSLVEPKFGRPIGAFNSDVLALEARLDVGLPAAYREYLLWIGADFHGLLRGSDCFISHVEANEVGLIDLLKENNLPSLTYKPVVFFLHQGYIAFWFNADEVADDPLVFSFSEADCSSGIRTLGTFSAWLFTELSSLAKAYL